MTDALSPIVTVREYATGVSGYATQQPEYANSDLE